MVWYKVPYFSSWIGHLNVKASGSVKIVLLYTGNVHCPIEK